MCISVEYRVRCSLSPQAKGMNINDGILLCVKIHAWTTHILAHTVYVSLQSHD